MGGGHISRVQCGPDTDPNSNKPFKSYNIMKQLEI